MNLPAVIDVAIGLVVLFFLLSTVCSFALELVATWRWWRKRLLYEMIGRLITGRPACPAPPAPVLPKFLRKSRTPGGASVQTCSIGAADDALDDFWEHPLAKNLAPDRQIPSYVESSTFAAIVIDIAVPGSATGAVPATAEGIEQVIDLGVRSGEPYLKPLRSQLLTIFRLREVRGVTCPSERPPLVELGTCIEKWYNEAMDRLSGQYKRRAQRALLLLGLLFALAFNADTVRTAYILSTDDSLRSAVAAYGATLVANTNAPVLATDPGSLARARAIEVQVTELRTNLVHSLKELQRLQQLGFPLGWKGDATLDFVPYDALISAPSRPRSGGWWFLLIPLKAAGLLATAFAVSLGAPFWFDLLNKLISLRGSGKRASGSEPSETKGEGASAPTTSMAAASSATRRALTPAPVPPEFGKDLADGRLGFNVRKAYWSAEAALLAYAAAESIRSAVQQWSLEAALIFEKTEAAQGFLALDNQKKVALLAFRGTEKRLEDWTTDAKFEPTRSPTGVGRTHRGFTDELDRVYAEVTAALKQQMGPDTLLYVVGHSLGGALATLMAARLVEDRICGVHAVLTFGSPRVGDRDFAKAYELALGHCTYRLVHGEDLVTRVPPRLVPATDWHYDHVGRVVYFDSDGRMHLGAGFWERFLNTVINAAQDFRNTAKAALRDHSMEGYARLLKSQVEG